MGRVLALESGSRGGQRSGDGVVNLGGSEIASGASLGGRVAALHRTTDRRDGDAV